VVHEVGHDCDEIDFGEGAEEIANGFGVEQSRGLHQRFPGPPVQMTFYDAQVEGHSQAHAGLVRGEATMQAQLGEQSEDERVDDVRRPNRLERHQESKAVSGIVQRK
jgi:hypothetical protein